MTQVLTSGPKAPFKKTQRLRRRQDFARVFKEGIRVRTAEFTFVARAGCETARLGISAGRKIGGAVVRNRVRRLVRESFRMMQTEIPVVDLVVVAHATEQAISAWHRSDVERMMRHGLRLVNERLRLRS